MRGGFPLLGEGSGIGSRIREKYLDRPLSSLRPFPTTFKRSILRRFKGSELIYRAAAPPLIPPMLSLTSYLERKYVLNFNGMINIFLSPNLPNCRISSPVGPRGRLFPTLSSPELDISIHPYGLQNAAPGELEEREKPSGPGYKSPMVFQRWFASFSEEGRGAAGWGNVYLRGTNRGFFAGSDGRSQLIPTLDYLNKKWSRDAFSVISGRGMMPGFEGRSRSGTNEGNVERSTIVAMPSISLLYKERSRYERSRDTPSIISGTGRRPGFGGRNWPGTDEGDGQRSTIVTMPPIGLLRRERSQDASSIISGAGTGPGFGWSSRSSSKGSVGRMMIFTPKALAPIRGPSPSSTVGADLEMMARPPLLVRRGHPSMNGPPFSRGDDQKGDRPQISKPGSENQPSQNFVEGRGRDVPARYSAASEPRMTYRRYPEMEQIEPVETKIIKEIDLLREKKSGPDSDRRSIDLNLDRISDQVYSMIERRIRTERERRGLYG